MTAGLGRMVGNFSNSVSGVKYERSRRVKKERAREREGEREKGRGMLQVCTETMRRALP